MHGDAEYPQAACFADWKIALRVPEVGEGGLKMQGSGVIDGRRDASLLEAVLQVSAVLFIARQERVLRPNACSPARDDRDAHAAAVRNPSE